MDFSDPFTALLAKIGTWHLYLPFLPRILGTANQVEAGKLRQLDKRCAMPYSRCTGLYGAGIKPQTDTEHLSNGQVIVDSALDAFETSRLRWRTAGHAGPATVGHTKT